MHTPLVAHAYKIHQPLVPKKPFRDVLKVRILVADYNRFSVLQNFIDAGRHQSRYVRNAAQNEISIGADQFCQIHILVKDAEVIALPY